MFGYCLVVVCLGSFAQVILNSAIAGTSRRSHPVVPSKVSELLFGIYTAQPGFKKAEISSVSF